MPMDARKYSRGASYKMIEHYIRYQDTGKEVKYANPDIDKLRISENYHIGVTRDDKYKYLKDKVAGYDAQNPPKRVRKDRVVMVGFCFTVPEEIADTPQERAYFEHCYEWLKKNFGEQNIVCAEVHRDEIHEYYDTERGGWTSSRAHMHAGVIPVCRDEKGDRVNGKGFMNRDHLKQWHADLDKYIYEHMGVHDLTFSAGRTNGRNHEELKRESIQAQSDMRSQIDQEVADAEKRLDTKRREMNRDFLDTKRKCEEQHAELDELNRKLLDAKRKKGKTVKVSEAEYTALKDWAEKRETWTRNLTEREADLRSRENRAEYLIGKHEAYDNVLKHMTYNGKTLYAIAQDGLVRAWEPVRSAVRELMRDDDYER